MQPSVVYCIYRMVIISMLTYDSKVQWPGFTYKISRMELKLQRSDCLVITGATSTAPNVAMQVLLFMWWFRRKPSRDLQSNGQLAMYPKATNFGHATQSWKMKHEPILQMQADSLTMRYAYHKPFTVKLSDKCEWQNGFNPDNRGAAVWFGWVQDQCRHWCWGEHVGLNKGHTFSLALHATIF